MSITVTVGLGEPLARRLDEAARRANKSRSDIAREALIRHLALISFERLRGRIVPFAEAQGYLTDEDVFRDVS